MIIWSYDTDIRNVKCREIEGKGAMKMEKLRNRREEQGAHFIRVSIVSEARSRCLKIREITCEFHTLISRAGSDVSHVVLLIDISMIFFFSRKIY